jgi:GTP-binding protein HflX
MMAMKNVRKSRFLLVGIQPKNVSDQEAFGSWRELWQLVESYGGEVVDTVIQKREVHDKGMYIGRGKLIEVQQAMVAGRIDVVVLHDEVKPGQLYEMQLQLTKVKPEVEVWDRVDLILQIFSQHAHTAEARLQIELASMRHMGPRIYGMGIEMSRQGGGIGGRGIGETNTERMKRHWSAQMKKVEDKLAKMASDRQRQLQHRARIGLKTVSLIGYTNAGKTQLYNRLVSKQKFSDNMLFATLDASVGKLYLPASRQELLISDTIGFIQGLPPELLQAFRSTLMESLFADVLVQVVDVSDETMKQKMVAVEGVLKDLDLAARTRILAFNKVDAVEIERSLLQQQYADFNPHFISAATGEGVDELVMGIEKLIAC